MPRDSLVLTGDIDVMIPFAVRAAGVISYGDYDMNASVAIDIFDATIGSLCVGPDQHQEAVTGRCCGKAYVDPSHEYYMRISVSEADNLAVRPYVMRTALRGAFTPYIGPYSDLVTNIKHI